MVVSLRAFSNDNASYFDSSLCKHSGGRQSGRHHFWYMYTPWSTLYTRRRPEFNFYYLVNSEMNSNNNPNADPNPPDVYNAIDMPSQTKFILTGEIRDSEGKLVVDADDSIQTSQWDEIKQKMKLHLQKNLFTFMDVEFGGDHGSGEVSFDVDSVIPPMKFSLKAPRNTGRSRVRNLFTRRKGRQLTMTFHPSVV